MHFPMKTVVAASLLVIFIIHVWKNHLLSKFYHSQISVVIIYTSLGLFFVGIFFDGLVLALLLLGFSLIPFYSQAI